MPGTWDVRQCPRAPCRLVWLDPVPTEAAIGQAYATYFTHVTHRGGPQPAASWPRRAAWGLHERVRRGYLQAALGYRRAVGSPWGRVFAPLAWAPPGGPDVMAASAAYFPAPPPGGRVLDVGCGGGEQLERLRHLGWEAEGVDFDPAAVAAARARGLTVHLGTVADQQFRDDSVDAILLSHVLEHLHDPIGVLAECRRLLKPGGRLVVVTPNAASLGHRRFGSDWLFLDPPRHLMLFSPGTLRCVAARAGLQAVEVRTSPRVGAWVYQCSAELRRTGRLGGARPGRGARLRHRVGGVLFQLAQRGLIGAGRHVGEEALLTATA